MNQKRSVYIKAFVPGFTIILSLVLILMATSRIVQTEAFIKNAKPASGTVLESHPGLLAWSAWIKVAFIDAAGASRTAKFETGGETTRFKKGDAVHLLYDTRDKSTVFVGNPRLSRYPMAGIYFSLGGLLLFFTLRRFYKGKSWD